MQIDWLTVGAQIANFLVLVWLLRRFLYAPVIGAMERRERRIAARLADAEAARADAEREAARLRAAQEALERERAQAIEAAREAAAAERRALEHAAREEVEARKRDWLGQLEAERAEFLAELRRRAAEEFCRLARRALDDLADAALEEQVARAFLDRLDRLDAEARGRLAAAARNGGAVRVLSRFGLAAQTRRQLTRALHETLGAAADIAYATDEGVACGIELRVGSQTVGWSLASYLDGFERTLAGRVPGGAPATEGAK